MITIRNESKNPYFNLALEEYMLKYFDCNQNIAFLWQDEPTVVVGRNQNTVEEVNGQYIKDHHIHVVRRLSGGGAVYHDHGNLNFTFIMKNQRHHETDFKMFTEPVIKTLAKLGIHAEFSGRNDITIEGKKFSGNAQYYYQNHLLHHGTILFHSDLSVVQEALNVKQDKIESKGIKSVRSRVTNIFPYLKKPISIEAFKKILLDTMLETGNLEPQEYLLTNKDVEKIEALMKERYMTWEWNYGESPNFNIQKSRRFSGGNIDIRLNIHKGWIKNCKIYGDFFGHSEIVTLETMLKDVKYEEETIRSTLRSIDLNHYFLGITLDDFINCLFY
ncbi:lipoate--protein ligase [Clostridiaceae bacterium 35-E11]